MQFEIPIFRPPSLDLRLLHKHLEASIREGRYSNGGPAEQALEHRLCEHFGLLSGQLTLLANATLALEAALTTRSEANDEWLIPSWSFSATGLAALRSGVKFSLGDVRLGDGVLLPPKAGERQLGVAPFGSAPVGEAYSGMDIVDAAASFDSMEGVGPRLIDGTGYVISLHATKTLAAGEGGVFISKDTNWVQAVRSFANFGFESGTRISTQVGTNAKMSDLAAAFGLASLDSWQGGIRDSWRNAASEAASTTSALGLKSVFAVREGRASPYWIIKLDSSLRKLQLVRAMAEAGIETRDWWGRGIHTLKPFVGIRRDGLTNTSEWVETSVALPLYPGLTSENFGLIRQVLERII